MEETTAGNKYILMCIYQVVALPAKSRISVAGALSHLSCRHRCCKIAINDQGGEFVNQVNKRLLEHCGVDQRIYNAYHPQTNGLTERSNRCLVNMLRKLADSADCWDSAFKPALFA